MISKNISWSEGGVPPHIRAQFFGHRGAVIWLTGLSGSGKSTIAIALEKALILRKMMAFVLDGDNLRHGLCADLGFSSTDRSENIRRTGEVARLMAESGLIVIVALISPFRADRARARTAANTAGIPFLEVFLSASLADCEKRDRKGLYAKARAGEIKGFTGIDSPYEVPERPDIELRTAHISIDQTLELLLNHVLEVTRSAKMGDTF